MKKDILMNKQVGDFLHNNKKHKKRRFTRGLGKKIIIIIVILYIISRIPPFLTQAGNKVYIAQFGNISEQVFAEGYIVRNEKVIKNFEEGEINLIVPEGEKVAKGQKIATIHYGEIDDKTIKDLDIINLRIEKIKDKDIDDQIFSKDIEKIDEEILKITKEIQDIIKNNKYEKIDSLKLDLMELVDKKSILNGEKSFMNTNLEQLERQQQRLQEKVDNSIEIIYSEFPGIIALGSDGLEEVLTLNNIENLNVEDMQSIENTYKNLNESNDEKTNHDLRIINSHQWSILTMLKEEDAQGLKEGKAIKIRQRGDNREYNAVVRKINHKEGENAIIIIDATEFMEDFHNKRKIELDIIKNSYDGIMIPNTSIIEKDGQLGVYRIDINGFYIFTPIKIKGSNRDYSIVYYGNFEEKREDETIIVNTINFYDEIAINADKITEGMRIGK